MTDLWSPLLERPETATPDSQPHWQALTEHRIITLTGPDAITFLQGQCTCDFEQLRQDKWTLGAHCNAKGQMLSSFVGALLESDKVGLRVHHSITQSAMEALNTYAIFSKANLEISSYLAAAINLEDAPALPLPTPEPLHFAQKDSRALLYTQYGKDKWLELWAPADDSLWQDVKITKGSRWQESHIKAGVAEVQTATQAQHLPQAFNFDCLDGVNFKKGCYTGQEIIARVHYKGKSKQRLHLVSLEVAAEKLATPAVGHKIVNSSGKMMGSVIGTANHDGKMTLQVCTSAFTAEKTSDIDLYLANCPTYRLQALTLPYAIP